MFLIRHFGFLEDHIVRMPSRTAMSLKNKVAVSQPAPTPSGDSSRKLEQLPEPRAEPSAEPESHLKAQPREPRERTKGRLKACIKPEVLQTIHTQQADNARLQGRISSMLEPANISSGAPGWGRSLNRWQKPAKRPSSEKHLRLCK